jgi:hypothetical protein
MGGVAMLQLRRLIAGFALLLALLAAAALAPSGCALDDCARPAACCASCEATRVRRASCACAPDEVSALECPKRSACALSHYVGDHAAACCRGSCASAESYEEASGRCPEQDDALPARVHGPRAPASSAIARACWERSIYRGRPRPRQRHAADGDLGT